MRPRRIDTHHHIVPPAWAAALDAQGYFGGQAVPKWSPAAALDLLGELDIETAIVSVGRPGVWFGDAAAARGLARSVNEYAAGLSREHPGRFGFFATLPLPDVDGALTELAHARDTLGADGVILLTNYEGTYLGDPRFEPLVAELAAHDTVAFVHPTAPAGPPVPGVPPFSADFLLDTTRAALNLVRHGVLSRLPGLRMVLSHAGGFLPYAAHRIASLTPDPEGRDLDRDAFLGDLRRFWFDTALSSGSPSLAALLDFADPSRVLYGSDWPYARGDNAQYFTRCLDEHPLDPVVRAGIERENARALLRLEGSRTTAPVEAGP